MLATFLAFALVFTMATPAFAADPYAIIKQPTKDSPTVEVSEPLDVVSYQWYKRIGSEATAFTPDSDFFDGYCCGMYDSTKRTWISYYYSYLSYPAELDLAFDFTTPAKLKITLTSDDPDFTSFIYEYSRNGNYVSVGNNVWMFDGDYQTWLNPEICGSAPFTATIEAITADGSYTLTDSDVSMIYDGSWDSANAVWTAEVYSSSSDTYDQIDFYVDGVFPGMIVKFTPDNYSSEAEFYVSASNNYDYTTYEDGGSYYIEFGSDVYSFENLYFECETLTENAAFTADIEILSATGNIPLLDQTTETLTEYDPGASYFCEITYYDGTVLTTDTISYGAGGGAYAGMFMVLLLKKRDAAAEAEQPEDTTEDTVEQPDAEVEDTEDATETPADDTTEEATE